MNGPPLRLLESAELSSAERSLLEAGRAVAPVHYDVAAGAAKLHAALATLPASSTAATVGTAKALTLIKLSAVLIPIVGAATFYSLRASGPPQDALRAPIASDTPTLAAWDAPTPPALGEAAPPVPAPAAEATHEARAEPPAEAAAQADTRRRARERASRAAPRRPADRERSAARATTLGTATTTTRPSDISAARDPEAHADNAEDPVAPAQPETPTEPSLAPQALAPPDAAERPAEPAVDSINELRAIAQARAMVDRDPGATLSLLRRLERAHPRGYFVEERQALLVLALAKTGEDTEAHRRAVRFLQTYPRSPFADRVRAAVAR